MIFTNLHNLPAPLVAALSTGWAPNPQSISVTALINPPRIRTLIMQHWADLTEDVSGRLWALLGQCFHSVLSKYPRKAGILVEHAIKAVVDGVTISGRLDLYEDGAISDYKVTSVYSFLLGDKPEWTAQANVYAFLCRSVDLPVRELNVHAILRDFVESKGLSDPDYPKIPFMTVPLELWSPEECEAYIKERIRLHTGEPMAPCTDAERWAKPNQYAVYKKGNKKALRVLGNVDMAQEWGKVYHKKNPEANLEIQERKGEFVRCSRFCNVKNFCEMNEYINPATGGDREWEDMENG